MPTLNERCKILRSLNRVYVFEIVLLLVPRLKILRRRGLSYFGIFEKQEAQSSSQEANYNNSGAKIVGGFLRSEKRIFSFFSLFSASLSCFFLLFHWRARDHQHHRSIRAAVCNLNFKTTPAKMAQKDFVRRGDWDYGGLGEEALVAASGLACAVVLCVFRNTEIAEVQKTRGVCIRGCRQKEH